MGALLSSSVLVLRPVKKTKKNNVTWPVIDHHFMSGSPSCTNQTIATVKCACAAVIAAAVVALVLLQRARFSSTSQFFHSFFKLKVFTVVSFPRAPSQFSIVNKCFPTAVFSRARSVDTISSCFFISSSNIVSIQSLLSQSFTVCIVTFIAFKNFLTVLSLTQLSTCFLTSLGLTCLQLMLTLSTMKISHQDNKISKSCNSRCTAPAGPLTFSHFPRLGFEYLPLPPLKNVLVPHSIPARLCPENCSCDW